MDMPQETIQMLDVVLRESPSWNYVTVSRSFFSTTFGHRGDIGEGLECWRGYYQSLCLTQMGLSLNIDISATFFFKPVTVVQFVLEFLNLCDASRPLTDMDRVKIKKALRGVRVETNHQEDKIRRYKITGITPVPTSQLIFPVDERGTRMSVVQYFMQRYKYSLKYTAWPCLQSGSDARPVYLPMEVTNILRATCHRPQQREQSICEMVLHNKYAEDRFAQEFGINVCSDLVSVPACVLPPPMLRYHDSGKEKTCAPSVGQWNMINKKMINGGIIDNWACVSFSCMRPEEVHRDGVSEDQFSHVLLHEMDAIRKACASLEEGYMPPVTFVVVQKRHHTRLFPEVHGRCDMTDKSGNILPGTVVDLMICHPKVFDFYLCSHAGIQGTSRPTHYHVLYDENHFTDDALQSLTNNLCYIYAHCTRAVSVVQPAYYAHLAAFCARYYVEGNSSDGGSTPGSSGQAAIALEGPVEVHQLSKIKENVKFPLNLQPGGVLRVRTTNAGMIRELLIAFRRKTGRRPNKIIYHNDGEDEGYPTLILVSAYGAIREACASLDEDYLPSIVIDNSQERQHPSVSPEISETFDNKLTKAKSVPPAYCAPLATFCDCCNTEGDNSDGASTPGSSGQAAVAQVHPSKDTITFTIASPFERFAVHINQNEKCYILRKKIEDKLQKSIHQFSLYVGSQILQNEVCLKSYAFPSYSTVQMNVRFLGGGDTSRAKRGRNCDPQSTTPDPPRNLISMQAVTDYLKSSPSFWIKVEIPNPDIIGQNKLIDGLNSEGFVFANSLIKIWTNAQLAKQSWDGEIVCSRDIVVIDGRCYCTLQPTIVDAKPLHILADAFVLAYILKVIFVKGGKTLPHVKDYLHFLRKSEDIYDPLLLPFKTNPFAFKSPKGQADVCNNLIKFYFDLDSASKTRFQNAVNTVKPENWPAAKTMYIFKPIVDFQVNKHGFDTYKGDPFHCFTFVRNYDEHSLIVPWDVRYCIIPIAFRDFMCKLIRALLRAKFKIEKALQ